MIGKIIKEKRLKLKLSQKEVSDYLNISIQRLNNFENEFRIPSLEFLGPLSILLDFNIDYPLNKQNDKSLEFDINIFKDRLKDYRINKNYSLQEFSELLNITRQTLSKYEKGNALPNIDDFYEISKIMNVLPSSLVCLKKDGSKEKKNKLFIILIPLIVIISIILFFLFNRPNNTSNSSISSNQVSSSINLLPSSVSYENVQLISEDTIDFLNETINVFNNYKDIPNNEQYNIYFNDPNLQDFSFIYKEEVILTFYFDYEKYIDHYLLDGNIIPRYSFLAYEYDLYLTPVYVTYEDYFANLKYEPTSFNYNILDIKEGCTLFIVPSSIYGISEFEISYINDDVTTFICDKSYVTFNTLNINKIPSSFFINAKHLEFIDSPSLDSNIDIVAIHQFTNYRFSSDFMTYNYINFLYVSSDQQYEYFLFFNNTIFYIYSNEYASLYLSKFLKYR